MARDFAFATRVACADGFTISIQASSSHYSCPRDTEGPWINLELGFPSSADESLREWAEDDSDLANTVYPYTPASAVVALLDSHGGPVFANGHHPEHQHCNRILESLGYFRELTNNNIPQAYSETENRGTAPAKKTTQPEVPISTQDFGNDTPLYSTKSPPRPLLLIVISANFLVWS